MHWITDPMKGRMDGLGGRNMHPCIASTVMQGDMGKGKIAPESHPYAPVPWQNGQPACLRWNDKSCMLGKQE